MPLTCTKIQRNPDKNGVVRARHSFFNQKMGESLKFTKIYVFSMKNGHFLKIMQIREFFSVFLIGKHLKIGF
jgi:hypothetical protein